MNVEELKTISDYTDDMNQKNVPKSSSIVVQRIMEKYEHYYHETKKSLCMCSVVERKRYQKWVSIKMQEIYNV